MSISIFLFRYSICKDFIFNREDFWHLIKFGESFSLNSLLNQSQIYQGNPCGVYPNLSSLSRSDVIQNIVTCIKWFVSSKDHINMHSSKVLSSWRNLTTKLSLKGKGWSELELWLRIREIWGSIMKLLIQLVSS